tara:strand:- start:633 stop:746 length:114 start_codon:yes stop_codon:yes gene_type:complete
MGSHLFYENLDHSSIAYMAPELVEQIEIGEDGKTSKK